MDSIFLYKKLIISCIIKSFFWITLMILIRHQNMFNIDGKDNLWLIFFSIVGIIYAITIAFLLVVVLEKFNRFSESISKEINLIEDVRDFMIFIKSEPELQRKTYKNLIEYVRFFVKNEWEKMKECRRKKENYDADTCQYIYEVMKCVTQLSPHTQSGKIALKEIISKIGKLTTIRTERINLSSQSLSPLLYFYLQFMGSMLIIPFMLFNGGNIYIQSAMIFAVVCAIRILYEIVKDFDNPLVGLWNVSIIEMELFLEKESNKNLNKMFFEEFTI